MVKFGKLKTTSQVGAEYQAIIPPLMEEYKPSEDFRYGLPIPVKWVRDDQSKTITEEAIESNNAGESAIVDDEKESKLKTQDNDLLPLPGLVTETWSAIEHGSFLLGLYLYAKNFPLVKRFMGSKGMGSIMSYYYGEFYKSDAHRRWSKWRKERRNRPLNARKLFTGWSHHELISRLSSNVTDEVKDRLIKDGTRYIEGRLSLTRFIFNLKENVGMNLLVEAVAIGQEERDLLEFRPISDCSYVSLEVTVPIANTTSSLTRANTASSLTPQEILKILKGDARLSKRRSSDLFWDYVWPRLLARGWNSEQPRSNVLQNPKNLVYLVPGVTEFSRNELKKGIHYFDSLTDVLSKVASEPELLELESDQEEPVNSDANKDPDNQEHQDYVEPDVPQSNQDLKMFTIVDASLDRDKDGIFKLTELPTYMVEEETGELDVTESRNQASSNVPQSNLDSKPFTIVDTSLDRDKDGVVQLMELPNLPVSEPTYHVEQGPGENIGFQEKTSSGNNGEHEEMVEEPRSKNKHEPQIIIDLNLSRMIPHTDPNQSSLSAEPTSNQVESSNGAGANMQQQLVLEPQRRYSTRSRMLSTKALEALAFGYLSPKKKRKTAEEKTPRQTIAVSSGGARNVENAVNGALNGATDTVERSPE
ncbi:uncharacterized protein LOC112517802 [Cynara cardunculus var. scolymus]|uniref:Homeodomain-like protein n=1 Tax=Cynara cardunculus var. scolymus TaxID=59895 RepID=A0A124SCP5_CYNCS|nr:uncharacterized protein LOC112517802 [Cynara cardunculus var. scolymus]KVH94447.1 Homeodomain-like protein [Cynara cardunculus var. scolymus]